MAGISESEHIVRDITCHDRSGADHDVVPDRYTRHDADVAADPDIVANRDIDTILVSGVSRLRVKRVSGRAEHDIRATHEVVPDRDSSYIQNHEVIVRKEVRPDRDVVTVIAEERRLDAEVSLFGSAKDLAQELFALLGLVRRQIVVLENFRLIRHTLLGKPVQPGLVWQIGQHSLFMIHTIALPLRKCVRYTIHYITPRTGSLSHTIRTF